MIERKDHDGIRVLKLAHGKVSAMDLELGEAVVAEMTAAADPSVKMTAAADPSVKAVVITGSGSSFSAGVDLFRLIKEGADYTRRFLPVLDQLLKAALIFPKPLIAAINGHAIAGGCILAAACDHRIMVEGNGRIGVPELAVGVPFPALPLQIMAGRLADGPLRDLVFTGRTVQVDEAKALGLIDEKCPAGMLMDRAIEVAQRMASIPAGAFALTKEAFYAPIVERAARLADLNARVSEEWMQQHTYDTIRKYLDKTIRK
jgi:enoyl-CoA hydratase